MRRTSRGGDSGFAITPDRPRSCEDAHGPMELSYGGCLRFARGVSGVMSGRATNPVRKPRADAVRNRERLLEAAADIFSRGGPDAMFEAVYRREVDQLSELAERLAYEAAPVEALRRWLHANVRLVATKKGMVAALALAAHRPSELHAYSADRLTKAVGSLLNRAAEAGEIRTDITPEDLLRALVGMSYNVYDTPDWRKTALRLADIFVDGLCKR